MLRFSALPGLFMIVIWLLGPAPFLFLCSTGAARAADNQKTIDLGPAEGESRTSTEKSGQPAPKPAASDQAVRADGVIEGTILPAERVRKVRLVERQAKLSREAAYDSATGKFRVDKLPAGVWAVEVETSWGRVEGVDLRWRPAELAKLAPEDYKKANESKPPVLSDEDRAEIRRHITEVERFMKARPLTFVGDGRRASVLVDLQRDTDFHSRRGDELLWRLEVWYYQNLWGTWERVGGQVVFRERVDGQTFRDWTRQFEPALGGLEIASRTTGPLAVNYTVPELPSRSRGLVAEGQKVEPAAEPAEPAAEKKPVGDKKPANLAK